MIATSRRAILAAAALALAIGACAGMPEPVRESHVAGQAISITLLHVNDSHGQLEPESTGGYARLATLVNDLRSASASRRVFLVHCGDEFSRGDLLTRQTRGAANVTLMNHVGFDIWTPGNGEFYDGVANLQARIQQAQFPVLAANVRLQSTGQYLSRPYVIERAGPVRVAFFGLCFVRSGHPSAKPLQLADALETARALVPQLRKQADLVVAVTHLGFREDLRLAGEVPGIDLILGGHSHTVLPKGYLARTPDRQVLICQAGDKLRYLGQVELKLTEQGEGYRLLSAEAKLIPIDQKVKIDSEVTALIARLSAAAERPRGLPAPTK